MKVQTRLSVPISISPLFSIMGSSILPSRVGGGQIEAIDDT